MVLVVLLGVYVFVVCGSNWLLPGVFCLVEGCLLFICVLVVWWFGLGAAMVSCWFERVCLVCDGATGC